MNKFVIFKSGIRLDIFAIYGCERIGSIRYFHEMSRMKSHEN
jgi:hypothetical protein